VLVEHVDEDAVRSSWRFFSESADAVRDSSRTAGARRPGLILRLNAAASWRSLSQLAFAQQAVVAKMHTQPVAPALCGRAARDGRIDPTRRLQIHARICGHRFLDCRDRLVTERAEFSWVTGRRQSNTNDFEDLEPRGVVRHLG